jgi:acetyl-CoA carboxylase biotin carboxyl carrier protein
MDMTFKELQELITLVNKSNLTEFKFENGDLKIRIRTSKFVPKGGKQVVQQGAPMSVMPPPSMPTPPVEAKVPEPPKFIEIPKTATTPSTEGGKYIEVKSPIVGTFYRSASPDKPPFVKVGDTIEKGTVVCVIEAMKLFNQIESDVKGKVVKVLAEDASPVEYDQVLFLLEP